MFWRLRITPSLPVDPKEMLNALGPFILVVRVSNRSVIALVMVPSVDKDVSTFCVDVVSWI
jgi:hypothetical protein